MKRTTRASRASNLAEKGAEDDGPNELAHAMRSYVSAATGLATFCSVTR